MGKASLEPCQGNVTQFWVDYYKKSGKNSPCSLQRGPGLEPVCLVSPSAEQQRPAGRARGGFLGYLKVSQGTCFLVKALSVS